MLERLWIETWAALVLFWNSVPRSSRLSLEHLRAPGVEPGPRRGSLIEPDGESFCWMKCGSVMQQLNCCMESAMAL
jgi:hypothetical protein